MSERGLLLALQRLHDDPGFIDMIAADPQNTLGIYDLDEAECDALIKAVTTKDETTLRNMASMVGIDWTADHVTGVGAFDDGDMETRPARHVGGPIDTRVSAFGTEWVTDEKGTGRSTNSSHDLAHDIHTGSPIKPAGS